MRALILILLEKCHIWICVSKVNIWTFVSLLYLPTVILEVLRKYPVIPFLERKCNNNYKIPETDVVIERGTPVFISVLGLHYDPQYFPNPEVFDPERFSKNNEDQIEKFVYLPFGDGPRNCIGMFFKKILTPFYNRFYLGARFGIVSAKLGLAYIISNFIVDICEDTQDKIKFNPNGLVLSSIKGISLKLRKI
jgi:cytochrome P450 family 6